jgi:hypothetical protein
MDAEVSLSCEDIECYLGEKDSRVHALGGVLLQLKRGTLHAVVAPPATAGAIVGSHPRGRR